MLGEEVHAKEQVDRSRRSRIEGEVRNRRSGVKGREEKVR